MQFISFNAMTCKGLNRKVNQFLETHTEIEIIDIRNTADMGNVFVAILYR